MSNQDDFNDNASRDSSAGSGDGGGETASRSGAASSRPIKEKIKALEQQIRVERGNGKKESPTGNAIRDAAVKVILKSAGSPEWDEFMSLFKFNQTELKKLVPSDDPHKNEALAYLIGGGVCGGSSIDSLETTDNCGMFGRVDDVLD